MNKKVAIILGSSRSNGNTRTIVDEFVKIHQGNDINIIDLNDYNIGYYDYEFKNANDDFINLIKTVLQFDTIIFATPIYWYTMSAQLKTFFDRLSDLLKGDNKPLGRQLRGKTMAVISCGSGDEVFDGFAMPFEKSAEYLGMHYKGHVHTWVGDLDDIPIEVSKRLKAFKMIT